ncbi:hypothetical protein [Nocardia panacis]|uniref:hypothetical protein n=1 Tax=Nocardia panacis TaxID=2340916 RepID=UPI0013156C8D|nr:hypothetical protein [Nocardia panacis]
MGWFELHGPKEMAEWVANAMEVAAGQSGRHKAEQQEQDRHDRQEKASRDWDSARTGANVGFDSYRAEHAGGFDPAVLVGDKLESFPSWSHQRIWDGLNDAADPVATAAINDAAQAWRDLAFKTKQYADEFAHGVAQDVQQMMQGRSAEAFIEATRQFCGDIEKLSVAQHIVARTMALHGDYLGQVKDSVPPPENSGGFSDMLIDHLPFQGYFKGTQHRADEAEKDAQRVMQDVYQKNVVRDVDPVRPVLPTPSNPVNGPGGSDPGISRGGQQPGGREAGFAPTGPGGQPSGAGDSGGGSAPGTDGPKQDSRAPGGNPDPTGTNPSGSTAPAAVAPTDSSAGNSRQGGSGIGGQGGQPSMPGPGVGAVPGIGRRERNSGGPGANSGGRGTGGSGGNPGGRGLSGNPVGRVANPVPGAPGMKVPGESVPKGAARPGQSGMPGAPGGMPAAGRGKGDDEREVKTKDYLVWDRGSELLGTPPPALPPGGVIGE